MVNAGKVMHSTLLGEAEVLTLFLTLITLLSLDPPQILSYLIYPSTTATQRRTRGRQDKSAFYPK